MGNLPVELTLDRLCPLVKQALRDRDPYVCKTAAIAVAKLYTSHPERVQSEGFLATLETLLNHENATVVANVVAVLIEISAKSTEFDLVIDLGTANKLLAAIDECSEYAFFQRFTST